MHKNNKHRGYIVYEIVFSLLIICIMLPILCSALTIFSHSTLYEEIVQDQIKLRQLQRIFLLSYDIELENNQLHFFYNKQYMTLKLVNKHLVLSPGTQIFLEDIDEIKFELNDEIELYFKRKDIEHEKKFVYQ